MPKTRPSHIGEAVSRLRALTGLSQIEFARLCGISSGTLARVEARAKALPGEAARRIAAATGCMLKELLDGRLIALDGGPVTKETIATWTSRGLSESEQEEMTEDLAFQLKILLRACHGKNRSLSAGARLRQMFLDLAEESGLTTEDLAQAARLDAEVTAVEMSVAEAIKHPELRECTGWTNVLSKFSKKARISGVVERFRSWPELATPKMESVPLGARMVCHLWRLRLPDGTTKNLRVYHSEISGFWQPSEEFQPSQEVDGRNMEKVAEHRPHN